MAAHQPGPLLTVAIPTCNGAAHLAEAIQSILSQEGSTFDLVVSDDRSDDETLAVVRTAAGDRARIEVNSERLGLAGNWNRCAALARTPLVAIFHQDDVMLPGHLSAHAASFAADSFDRPDRQRVGCDRRAWSGGFARRWSSRGGWDRSTGSSSLVSSPRSMAAGNPLRCSAVTLRVAALRERRRLRLAVALRRRLGLLAAVIAKMAGRVAGTADRSSPLASGQRDPSLQDGAGRSRRDGAHAGNGSSGSISRMTPMSTRLRRAAHHRLGRAFLNRAHDALRAGLPEPGSRGPAPRVSIFTALDQDDRRRPQAVRSDGGRGRRPTASPRGCSHVRSDMSRRKA